MAKYKVGDYVLADIPYYPSNIKNVICIIKRFTQTGNDFFALVIFVPKQYDQNCFLHNTYKFSFRNIKMPIINKIFFFCGGLFVIDGDECFELDTLCHIL